MTASFGIDHPLIAVHDIEKLRERLIAMGFNMTAIGKHPWGTSTSLAMFNGCLMEIMGIYDDTLIDALPAGDFHFGRHVYEHLQQREITLADTLGARAVCDGALGIVRLFDAPAFYGNFRVDYKLRQIVGRYHELPASVSRFVWLESKSHAP